MLTLFKCLNEVYFMFCLFVHIFFVFLIEQLYFINNLLVIINFAISNRNLKCFVFA